MPPKRKPAAAASSRATRVTKTKAKETIQQAVKARPRRTVVTPPSQSPVPPSRSVSHDPFDPNVLEALVTSMPQIQGLENRLQNLELSLEDNAMALRSTVFDSFSQVMDRLDAMEARQVPAGPGLSIPGNPFSNNPPLDVLARWPWIDKATVDLIANGEFDINNLPKLFCEEELRNLHIKKVTEGVHWPVDGGKPELVTGRTKMHNAFKDMATFLSAWLVYISVRSSYVPERGPGLAFWTERVIYYAQSGFAWSTVLNYIVAYFLKHQNSPLADWYEVNSNLVAIHFSIARRNPVQADGWTSSASRSPGKKQNTAMSSVLPVHEQTCQNFNRPNSGCTYAAKNGESCPRKHRCMLCKDPKHIAPNCPSKSAS